MPGSKRVTIDGKRYTEHLLVDLPNGLMTEEVARAAETALNDNDPEPLLGAIYELEHTVRTEMYASLTMLMLLTAALKRGDDTADDAADLVAAAGRYLRKFPHFGKWFNEMCSDSQADTDHAGTHMATRSTSM